MLIWVNFVQISKTGSKRKQPGYIDIHVKNYRLFNHLTQITF